MPLYSQSGLIPRRTSFISGKALIPAMRSIVRRQVSRKHQGFPLVRSSLQGKAINHFDLAGRIRKGHGDRRRQAPTASTAYNENLVHIDFAAGYPRL